MSIRVNVAIIISFAAGLAIGALWMPSETNINTPPAETYPPGLVGPVGR
jgi:hypothetical protein